jgi:hypothetical protein
MAALGNRFINAGKACTAADTAADTRRTSLAAIRLPRSRRGPSAQMIFIDPRARYLRGPLPGHCELESVARATRAH